MKEKINIIGIKIFLIMTNCFIFTCCGLFQINSPSFSSSVFQVVFLFSSGSKNEKKTLMDHTTCRLFLYIYESTVLSTTVV